jgi:hypothetical protein
LNACTGNLSSYNSNTISNGTYLWNVNGGKILQGSASSKELIVLRGSVGTGTVTLHLTNPAGCSASAMDTIKINPLPTPSFTGNLSVCEKNTYIYTANIDSNIAFSWQITPGTGTISGSSSTNTCKIIWSAAGTSVIQLTETNTKTGCIDSVSQNITINPLPDITINGPNSVCPGDTIQYSAGNTSGYSSTWSLTGGKILGNTSDSLVVVIWGTPGQGKLNLTQMNSNDCKYSFILPVTINQKPNPIILGNITAQISSSQNYSSKSAPDYCLSGRQ